MPSVSVIIPVYNTEKYLAGCLDSVLSQSLDDIEVICIDDCSSDNSSYILEEYTKKDKRVAVYYLEETQRGIGLARNIALNYSTGKYIAFIDSDDFIDKDMLSRMYGKAIKFNADLVMCMLYIFKDGQKDNFKRKQYDLKIPETLFDKSFSWRDVSDGIFDFHFTPINKLCKKEFLYSNDINFPEGIYYEDLAFSLKLFLLAKKICFIPEALYYYRKYRQGAITDILSDRAIDAIKAMELMDSILKEKPEYYRLEERFLAFRFVRLLRYFYRNDATTIEEYYRLLKAIAFDPKLESNKFLNKPHKEARKMIIDNELYDYLMLKYWSVKNKSLMRENQLKKLKRQNKRVKENSKKLNSRLGTKSCFKKIFKKLLKIFCL